MTVFQNPFFVFIVATVSFLACKFLGPIAFWVLIICLLVDAGVWWMDRPRRSETRTKPMIWTPCDIGRNCPIHGSMQPGDLMLGHEITRVDHWHHWDSFMRVRSDFYLDHETRGDQ